MSDVKDYQVKEIGGFAWNGDSIYYRGKEEIPLGHNAKALLFSGATDSDGRLYYGQPY